MFESRQEALMRSAVDSLHLAEGVAPEMASRCCECGSDLKASDAQHGGKHCADCAQTLASGESGPRPGGGMTAPKTAPAAPHMLPDGSGQPPAHVIQRRHADTPVTVSRTKKPNPLNIKPPKGSAPAPGKTIGAIIKAPGGPNAPAAPVAMGGAWNHGPVSGGGNARAASAKAVAATKNAVSPGEHKAAASAHRIAANWHAKAGNTQVAQQHMNTAANHEYKAKLGVLGKAPAPASSPAPNPPVGDHLLHPPKEASGYAKGTAPTHGVRLDPSGSGNWHVFQAKPGAAGRPTVSEHATAQQANAALARINSGKK